MPHGCEGTAIDVEWAACLETREELGHNSGPLHVSVRSNGISGENSHFYLPPPEAICFSNGWEYS